MNESAINLQGVLYLGSQSKDHQQLVYASQLYGSFFTVYGKFIVDSNPDSSEVTIVSATYRLVNYKGIINIGLKSVKYDQDNQKIILNIQAFAENKPIEKRKDFRVDPSRELIFSRKLEPADEKINIHDDEFLYRDGDFTMQRPPYDQIDETNRGSIEKCFKEKVPADTSQKAKAAPGGRCMMSIFSIIE